jgi:hypothetical protein
MMVNDNNLGSFFSRLVNTKQCDCRHCIPLLPMQLTDRNCVHSVRQFLGVGGTPNSTPMCMFDKVFASFSLLTRKYLQNKKRLKKMSIDTLENEITCFIRQLKYYKF